MVDLSKDKPYVVRGYLQKVTVDRRELVIERKVALPQHGKQTRLDLSQAVDLEYRQPTWARGGYLRVVLRGWEDKPVSATLPAFHPHAVVFGQWQRRRAEKLYQHLKLLLTDLH